MADNKKDSFTFSDKIKNSKPAFNPFSKRVSSKIGNNGKPKKTIFERTRRDAPFFIAAAVALLMLPFLYKYSGSVAEEPFVTPGTEESVFEPERFGFNPTSEDPSGQISQLSGRDPLSLIKGWGDPAASSAGNMDEDFVNDRDGLGGGYDSPVQDTPRNSYRQNVPAQTRASFARRTTTPIKNLGEVSMTSRSGGSNYGRFGGSTLKSAAKADSSGGPKQGVKPVSLQRLVAVGNPSRSYFGQGPAAQARASRDAMGKANAMQALNDAMFRPMGPGHASGNPMTGHFAPGGGPGKWDNKMDYKGITPWWWDMMKEREQKKWEWKYFLWRKNLVEPLIKGLAEIAVSLGKGLACCLLTGKDDCGMGQMWGTNAAGSPSGCKINGTVYTSVEGVQEACPGGNASGTLKDWCQSEAAKACGKVAWEEGTLGGSLNFFQVRGHCLGATVQGSMKGEPKLSDYYQCKALDSTHSFKLQPGGEASKWHLYHAVVAKNYNPFNSAIPLCGSSETDLNPHAASPHAEATSDGSSISGTAVVTTESHHLDDELKPEEVPHYCVIYVAEGDVFSWDTFKQETQRWLEGLKQNVTEAKNLSKEEAFNALHLAFVEGYAFKDSFSKKATSQSYTVPNKEVQIGGQTIQIKGQEYQRVDVKMPIGEMPVLYRDFELKYVLNKDNDPKPGKTYKYKPRLFASSSVAAGGARNQNTTIDISKADAVRMYCPFASFQIKAKAIDSLDEVKADLTFKPEIHGNNASNIQVTVDFLEAGIMNVPTERVGNANNNVQPFKAKLTDTQITTLTNKAKEGGITAHWVAWFDKKTSTDEATYFGGEVIPDPVQPAFPCDPQSSDPAMRKHTSAGDPCIYFECKADKSGWDYDNPQRENTPECRDNSCQPGSTMDLRGNVSTENPPRPCQYLKCSSEGVWEPEAYIYTDRPGCESGCEPGTKLDLQNLRPTSTDGRSCFYLLCTQNRKWSTVTHRYSDAERRGCGSGPVPPIPPTAVTKVQFIDDFKKVNKDSIIKNPMWREHPTGSWRNCKIDLSRGARLVAWDASIEQVYSKAKDEYDRENRRNHSELENNFNASNPGTAATLFDALMLYPGNQVPKNAVCMLGKTIGAGSVDTTVTRDAEQNSNMFGAFAAFIGEDASFFPTSRYRGTDGEAYCNQQFIGCGANRGDNSTCRAGVAKKYHWGHYNVSKWKEGRTTQTANTPGTMRHIDRAPWTNSSGYILRELDQRVSYHNRRDHYQVSEGNNTVENANREKYWRAYGEFFQHPTSCGLEGTMSKQAVIDYIEVLCNSGTNIKPSNTDWLSCGMQAALGTSGSGGNPNLRR